MNLVLDESISMTPKSTIAAFAISCIPIQVAASTVSSDDYVASDFGYQYDLGGRSGRERFYVTDPDNLSVSQSETINDRGSDFPVQVMNSVVNGSLRTGSIGIAATSNLYGSEFSTPQTRVVMKDQLFFDLTNLNLDDRLTVTFGFNVEAEFRNSSLTTTGPSLLASLFLRNDTAFSGAGGSRRSSANLQYGGQGITSLEDGLTRENLDGARRLSAGSYEVDLTLRGGWVNSVYIQASMSGTDGVTALNSARTSIVTNIDFTSSSGVFLAGPPISQVPLPASVWMLICSILTLGGLRKLYGPVTST